MSEQVSKEHAKVHVWPVLRAVAAHIHGISQYCLLLKIGAGVMEALTPFAPILLLSSVVGGLESGIGWQDMLVRLLIGLGIIAAMQMCLHALNRFAQIQTERGYILYESKAGQKMIQLDYEQVEDPAVMALRQRMRDNRNWGAGMYTILHNARIIAKSAVAVVAAIVLVAPVMAEGLRGPNALLWIAFVVFIAAMSLVGARYTSWLSKRMMDIMNSTTKHNHLLIYILRLLMQYASGKDMRIYRVSDIVNNDIIGGITPMLKRTFGTFSRIQGAQGGVSAALSAVVSGLSYLLVGLMALGGGVALGSVVLYAGGIGQFMQGFSDLTANLSNARITLLREIPSMDFMSLPYVKYRGTIPVEKRQDGKFNVEFRDVSFRYPGSEAYVLRHVNLRFNVGEKLAVVGRNGSGKTTLIKLLCRLYDPTEGEILLNGIDVRKYNYDEYMSLFSVVFQDFKVFDMTLGENVAASRKADAARAAQALGKAGFAERLAQMPQGLDTYLYKGFSEDGVELSGGEAQKVAIARALYKDAPFVVLDEPTAALDPIAEFDIYSRFDALVKDRTSIYISHRLSSCRFCHDILVLDEGSIVQRGGHDALLTRSDGLYAQMWNAQSSYYQDVDETI